MSVITLDGLSKKQKALASVLWGMASRDELDSFLSSLSFKDKRDAESKAYEDALRYKNAQLDRLKAEGYDATNMLTWDEKKKNEFQNRLKAIEKDPYYLTKLQQSGIPLKSTDTSSGENLNTSLPKTKVIGGKTYELQPNNKYIEK